MGPCPPACGPGLGSGEHVMIELFGDPMTYLGTPISTWSASRQKHFSSGRCAGMDRKGMWLHVKADRCAACERTHEMAKGFAALDPMLHVCGHVHGNLGKFGRHPALDEWKFTSLQFWGLTIYFQIFIVRVRFTVFNMYLIFVQLLHRRISSLPWICALVCSFSGN